MCFSAVAFAIGAVALAWSLMFQYITVKGEFFRVNRITGIRQEATSKGWFTDEQSAKQKYEADEKANASIERIMTPEREGARRALKTLSIDEKASNFTTIVFYNPSEFILTSEPSFKVEYFLIEKNGSQNWFYQEYILTGARMGSKDHSTVFVTDHFMVPEKVTSLPSKANIIQRITIDFKYAQREDGLSLDNFSPPLRYSIDRTFQMK